MNMAADTKKTIQSRINLSEPVSGQKVTSMLNEADVKVLREGLGKGLSGYARQGDLVELYNRLLERLEPAQAEGAETPSEEGASVPQATHQELDRLLERMHSVEEGVTGLEGALRIELAPFLGQVVQEAIAETRPQTRTGWTTGLCALVALGAGLTAGAVFSDTLLGVAAQAAGWIGL